MPEDARVSPTALARRAADDPTAVLDDLERLAALCSHPNGATRRRALEALARLAGERPDAVASVAPALAEGLTDGRLANRKWAVRGLTHVAEERPDAVAPVVGRLGPLLGYERDSVRRPAARTLAVVAEAHPEAVTPDVEALAAALDDEDGTVRGQAALALNRVAGAEPAAVEPLVEALAAGLTDGVGLVRSNGAGAIADVASEAPAAVAPVLNRVEPLLDDERRAARRNAALAFRRAADGDPEALAPHVEALAAALDDRDDTVRRRVLAALGKYSQNADGTFDPEVLVPHIGGIASLVDADRDGTRWDATGAFVLLAETAPEAMVPHLERLEPALRDEHPKVRRNAALAVAHVATQYPDDVLPYVDALVTAFGGEIDAQVEDALTALAATDPTAVRDAIERHAADPAVLLDAIDVPPAGGDGDDGTGAKPSTATRSPQPPDPAAAPSPPRRTLSYGDIEIVEEIGRGGQAIVSLARLPDGERVAVKEPRGTGTLDRARMASFLDEAATWAAVDRAEREQPNWADRDHIVGVVDIGDDLPWIAVEYMDGGSLADRLVDSPDGLPVAAACWIVDCVCRGVEVAHHAGVVHRDLKPANVLFRTVDDGWDLPKVADWGLARSLRDDPDNDGGLSVAVAALEQFDPETYGDPDKFTDIYQLGALAYWTLTGRPPYEGSPLAVRDAVTGGEPPPRPTALRPSLPPSVDDVLEGTLAPRKRDRYQSVVTFRRALDDLR